MSVADFEKPAPRKKKVHFEDMFAPLQQKFWNFYQNLIELV